MSAVLDDKQYQTARARLCLKGFELDALADGRFVVTRWNLRRVLADFAAVEAFVAQVGA